MESSFERRRKLEERLKELKRVVGPDDLPINGVRKAGSFPAFGQETGSGTSAAPDPATSVGGLCDEISLVAGGIWSIDTARAPT